MQYRPRVNTLRSRALSSVGSGHDDHLKIRIHSKTVEIVEDVVDDLKIKQNKNNE